jgi:Zn-dependent M28 family amino/carboxypeptidase
MTRRSGPLAAGLLVASSLFAACGTTAPPTVRPGITAGPSRPGPAGSAAVAPSPPAPTGSAGALLDQIAIGDAITEAGLRARLDELAAVSTAGNGFRALGSRGYDAAADRVEADLRAAGWRVADDRFRTPAFADPGGSTLTVGGTTFGAGDLAPLIFAPAGDVTGPVVAIGWDPDGGAPNARGCSNGDYAGVPAGAIVLVAPAPCRRREAILAAQKAGVAAFIAGYPAAVAGAALRPTLLEPGGLEIPAAGATRPVGDALAAAAAAGSTAHLVTRSSTKPADTRSIIAELPGTDPGPVVMVGAHLDSVVDGPGINDNGSGVAALLEIARALSGRQFRATIRLAFWSAEETGIHGSTHYVTSLSDAERDRIVAYLNADMLASPNGYAGVYDGNGMPPGSSALSGILMAAAARAGVLPTPIGSGASDDIAFAQAGVPIGGVAAGASEILGDETAVAAGSTAGKPADACYHQPCDDSDNVRLDLGRALTRTLAEAAIQLAIDGQLAEDR